MSEPCVESVLDPLGLPPVPQNLELQTRKTRAGPWLVELIHTRLEGRRVALNMLEVSRYAVHETTEEFFPGHVVRLAGGYFPVASGPSKTPDTPGGYHSTTPVGYYYGPVFISRMRAAWACVLIHAMCGSPLSDPCRKMLEGYVDLAAFDAGNVITVAYHRKLPDNKTDA